jgi:hypothetical protein
MEISHASQVGKEEGQRGGRKNGVDQLTNQKSWFLLFLTKDLPGLFQPQHQNIVPRFRDCLSIQHQPWVHQTRVVQIKAELEATLGGQGSTLRWTLGSLWRVQAQGIKGIKLTI